MGESPVLGKTRAVAPRVPGAKGEKRPVKRWDAKRVARIVMAVTAFAAARWGQRWQATDQEAREIAEPLAEIVPEAVVLALPPAWLEKAEEYRAYIALATAVGGYLLPRLLGADLEVNARGTGSHPGPGGGPGTPGRQGPPEGGADRTLAAPGAAAPRVVGDGRQPDGGHGAAGGGRPAPEGGGGPTAPPIPLPPGLQGLAERVAIR